MQPTAKGCPSNASSITLRIGLSQLDRRTAKKRFRQRTFAMGSPRAEFGSLDKALRLAFGSSMIWRSRASSDYGKKPDLPEIRRSDAGGESSRSRKGEREHGGADHPEGLADGRGAHEENERGERRRHEEHEQAPGPLRGS